MTLRPRSLLQSTLVLALCAVLFGAACKKKDDAAATGSGSATASAAASLDAAAAAPAIDAAEAAPPAADAAAAAGGGAGAAASTPELDALDKTVAPIVAMTDAEAGAKAACATLPTITKEMQAVSRTVPAGVDTAAWTDVADRMVGAMSDFEIECGEGSASDTKALAKSMEIAKEFRALLAKKAP
jgi:hypothetical protein